MPNRIRALSHEPTFDRVPRTFSASMRFWGACLAAMPYYFPMHPMYCSPNRCRCSIHATHDSYSNTAIPAVVDRCDFPSSRNIMLCWFLPAIAATCPNNQMDRSLRSSQVHRNTRFFPPASVDDVDAIFHNLASIVAQHSRFSCRPLRLAALVHVLAISLQHLHKLNHFYYKLQGVTNWLRNCIKIPFFGFQCSICNLATDFNCGDNKYLRRIETICAISSSSVTRKAKTKTHFAVTFAQKARIVAQRHLRTMKKLRHFSIFSDKSESRLPKTCSFSALSNLNDCLWAHAKRAMWFTWLFNVNFYLFILLTISMIILLPDGMARDKNCTDRSFVGQWRGIFSIGKWYIINQSHFISIIIILGQLLCWDAFLCFSLLSLPPDVGLNHSAFDWRFQRVGKWKSHCLQLIIAEKIEYAKTEPRNNYVIRRPLNVTPHQK